MSDYWVGETVYCWNQSDVLRNKLNIFEADKLSKVEADIVRGRAILGLPAGRFSLSHYKACHKWLFGDVYSWAGRFRTVRLAREESVFCYPEFIDGQMRSLFQELKQGGHLSLEHFASNLNQI
ncbi:MAG: hypothetical protein HC777_01550 [Hyphomonadaceae bacterium]|nr:hypothetical protein [Hyphomonadaceae bacterium]